MKVKMVFLLWFCLMFAISSAAFVNYSVFSAPLKKAVNYQEGQIISVPCNPGFVYVRNACRKTFPGVKKVDYCFYNDQTTSQKQ